jgi:MYXO-CTERM domain-containing protein
LTREKHAAGTARWVALSLWLGTATAVASPLPDWIESSEYPIRVYHDDLSQAEAALAAAEEAWALQVVGMGYPPPLRLADGDAGAVEEGFDLVVQDLGPGALATFDVLGDHPATPAADCPTLSRVNGPIATARGWMPMSVAHLLNHGSLHAIDCLEPSVPANDLITVAIVQGTTGDPLWVPYELDQFQSRPWMALDATTHDTEAIYYPFGAALFSQYLEEQFGASDGALLLDAWRRSAQDGTITRFGGEQAYGDVVNEPDLLDGYAATLEARGSSFDRAFAGFVEWRWFVGADDDGAHFAAGAEWTGCEVTREATLDASSLPRRAVPAVHPLAEYGAGYVELLPSGLAGQPWLRLGLAVAPVRDWDARVLLVPAAGAATVLPLPLDVAGHGTLHVAAPADWARIVLAIASLSDGEHDLEEREWDTDQGTYSYTVEVPVAPRVDACEPSELRRGETGVAVVARGAGFGAGPVEVDISGDGVEVVSAAVRDDETIDLVLDVAATAVPGARDLTVRADPLEGTGAAVLTVVEPTSDDAGIDDGGTDAGDPTTAGGGCACRAAGGRPATPAAALLLGLALFAALRRAWRHRRTT